MAIVNEFFETREDGINLYRTYSDENKQSIIIMSFSARM